MISDYSTLQLENLYWSEKLWDFKESNDLTVIGLSKKLNADPEQVEKWLSGFCAIDEDNKNKLIN
jgi:hypothetical protein